MKPVKRRLRGPIVVLALATAPLLGPAPASYAAPRRLAQDASANRERGVAAVAPRCAGVPAPSPAGAVPGGHAAGEYETAFNLLAGVIANHLPWPLTICHTIGLVATDIPLPGGGQAGALTGVYDSAGGVSGAPARCVIRVYRVGQRLPDSTWRGMLAHEVFHCFQGEVMPLPIFNSGRFAWIVEGQADWVAESVLASPAGEGEDRIGRSGWKGYLLHPETPLFARSYDAIGFYAHLAESGGDPWRVFKAMLQAPTDRVAYAAAVAGTDHFLDSWASGYFRGLGAATGRDWDTTGPGIPLAGTVHAEPLRISLANGQVAPVSAAPFANGIYTLLSGADIVRIDAAGGARLSDGNLDRVLQGQVDFCTRAGGCSCPPGSAYQGPPLTPLASRADLALTGGPDGTKVALTGRSLDDFCAKKPAPLPRGPGGPLPNPCTLVTLNDVEQIVGLNPDYIYRTLGPLGHPDAPGCEHLVVGAGVSGAVFIGVMRRAGASYSGGGTAITGYGDAAYLFTGSDYARLVAAKGRVVIIIQVTMGARSTQIALAVGRKALSRL